MKAPERRRQIVEKAAKVFAAHGLEGARTREIAQACGINEALLYKHFPSKKELFLEAMAYVHADAMESWCKRAERKPNGLAALRKLLELTITATFDSPEFCASAFHALAATAQDKTLRKAAAKCFAQMRECRSELIRRGIEDGSLRPDLDPERHSLWLTGITLTCILVNALRLRRSFTAKDARRLAKEILDFMAAPKQEGNKP
jgi:AcrR family transcriptional regulator